MLETLAFGTAASLLATGVSAGPDTVRDLLRKEEFSREVGDLPTEFHRTLRDSVRNAAENGDNDALTDIHENWDDVAKELDQLDMLFEDEEKAVERIATEIAAANGYDIDADPELERDLEGVVTETYITAITSFEEQVAGTELADRLQVEADIRLAGSVNQVLNRLETLKQRLTERRYYDIFTPDEVERIADRLADRSVEYIPRAELDDAPDTERSLVVGRAGSGKSRVLAERLPDFVDDEVTDIIVPREALTNPADLTPLENESFEGDVLLVWDDIHDLHPSENNTVFREAVQKLADILGEKRNSLSVLAAARAERIDTLPGPGKPGEVEGFWADYGFETVELDPLGTTTLAELFDRTLEEHGVNASDEVKDAFLTRAFKTDPSPFYVVSVVSTADDTLTEDDIDALPETVRAIWEEQYATLRTNHEEAKLVLWAINLLEEFQITRYRSLVRGVYETVFGPGRHSFNTAVETLREKQWLVLITGETLADPAAAYHVHDIQLEAVSEPVENHLRAFSEFLMDDLGFYLPTVGADIERLAHSQFALGLYDRFSERYNPIAEDHFERALTIDPDSAPTHYNYAKLLKEMGRRNEAETHYGSARRKPRALARG
ncbi:MAG: hypothetical protein ABEI80_09050 [Haloplanus sp.]